MQTALIGDLETAVERRPPVLQAAGTFSEQDPCAPANLLPLVIHPEKPNTNLAEWIEKNRANINALFMNQGAILFRGFAVESPAQFECAIEALSGSLLDYTYRSTPRTIVTGRIYTSTEYPPHQTIPLHNENSYTREWPMKIWFYSQLCAATGGETPIADSRRVYQRIPVELRERFERKELMYVRNYGSGFDLPWQEVFQTTDKAEVEGFCRAAEMEFEWLGEDRLRTRQKCHAVAEHPFSGETVWFNQAHLFHVSRLPEEVREAMLTIFAEEDLPRNVYYGDGSPIDSSDLDIVCRAYEEEKVAFPWQERDVLLLDNMLTAHARNPFTGQRKVVVGMAEPHSEICSRIK